MDRSFGHRTEGLDYSSSIRRFREREANEREHGTKFAPMRLNVKSGHVAAYSLTCSDVEINH